MKKSRFTETQIFGILKEAESGMAMADLLRHHGISGATFYKWPKSCAGFRGPHLFRADHALWRWRADNNCSSLDQPADSFLTLTIVAFPHFHFKLSHLTGDFLNASSY